MDGAEPKHLDVSIPHSVRHRVVSSCHRVIVSTLLPPEDKRGREYYGGGASASAPAPYSV